MSNVQIFKSCFINGIKNPGTDKLYKQDYNDKDKKHVLTKLLKIQQAYIQSTLDLNWNFYIQSLPLRLILLLIASSDYIIKVIKPLYDMSKASNL